MQINPNKTFQVTLSSTNTSAVLYTRYLGIEACESLDYFIPTGLTANIEISSSNPTDVSSMVWTTIVSSGVGPIRNRYPTFRFTAIRFTWVSGSGILECICKKGMTRSGAISDIASVIDRYQATGYAFSDAGVTLCTDGQSVQQWNDKQTAARHSTQTTAGARPTFIANAINGQSAVQFTAGDGMVLPNTFPSGAKSIAMVFRLDTAPGAGQSYLPLTLRTSGGAYSEFGFLNVGGYRSHTFICDFNAGASSGFNKALDTNWHVLLVSYNGGTSTLPASYAAHEDSVAQTVIASGAFARNGTDSASLGARVDAAGNPTTNSLITIADIVVMNEALTPDSISILTNEFNTLYGL